MQIKDLINNTEFTFNCPFKIVEYIGDNDDPDRTIIRYDSMKENDYPDELDNKWISAVNYEDNVVIIEFIELIDY